MADQPELCEEFRRWMDSEERKPPELSVTFKSVADCDTFVASLVNYLYDAFVAGHDFAGKGKDLEIEGLKSIARRLWRWTCGCPVITGEDHAAYEQDYADAGRLLGEPAAVPSERDN